MTAPGNTAPPIRLGFIGGAAPSMIGPVHLRAALLDRRFAVVAGALSRDAEKGRAGAAEYGIAPDRCYATPERMIAAEAARPDGIQAVAIVTPNDSHMRYVLEAAAAGLHVMVDKPLANSVAEGEAIAGAVAAHGIVLALAHAYSGYPMIREARAQVASGALGTLRMLQVEYIGAGLATLVEAQRDAPRRWRLDPAISGPSLVLGDIGTHAHHLACFVAGEPVARLSAEVAAMQPGRQVHDYAQVRFHLRGGARGALLASQAGAGAENHILLRVWGDRGHLEWRHALHNELRLAPLAGFPMTLSRGHPMLSPDAARATRMHRTGHPEGLHEAFANLWLDFADQVAARQAGHAPDPLALSLPGAAEGLAGLRFVAAALDSAAGDGAWVELPAQD